MSDAIIVIGDDPLGLAGLFGVWEEALVTAYAGALIPVAGLLTLTDHTGKIVRLLLPGLDPAAQVGAALLADVDAVFSGNLLQRRQWEGPAIGVTQSPAAGAAATGAAAGTSIFGSGGLAGGVVGGSFGSGSGLLARGALIRAALRPWLENGMRALIRSYALQDSAAAVPSASAISDLVSYAAFFNAPANPGGAAFSVLYSPDFAVCYYYCYGRQLPPACVFAPAGIPLGAVAVTGAGAATLTPAAAGVPTANGYMLTPGADAYGNPVYTGGLPMAQGFAPLSAVSGQMTTAANGTLTATLSAPNQAGTSAQFTATLSGLAVGAAALFAPVNAGDRIAGPPTAVAVAGTATAGAFSVVSVAERAYY